VILEALGAKDFGGFALGSGNMNVEASIACRQGELYPIGIEGIYVVVDE
jgi:hypothetical protein